MARKKVANDSTAVQIGGLTAMESRFCTHYLQTGNGTLSAMRAGYAPSCAKQRASENLQKPKIQLKLDQMRQALAVDAQLTVKDIIAELKKVGFSNMMDYMAVDEDGKPNVDLSMLTRDQAAALSETNTERMIGKDGTASVRSKVKTHNKIDALVNLGKIFGLFNDKVEHSGPNGGPIPITQRYVVRLVPCPKPTHLPSQTNQ
jgi:phage terminase small subunit